MAKGWALVTGAARRIGQTLAIECAQAGYDVVVHHRGAVEDAAETVARIEALGRRAVAAHADLTHDVERDALLKAADGPLTLLVNCASLFQDDRIETLTAESFDAHMGANLRAPVLLAQAFAAQSPEGGQIVNIVDQRVWRPNPQFFSYSLSKAGLWWATQTLAQALAPRIRVNAIGPGPTLASIHQNNGEFDQEAANVPLGKPASPDEIAAALRYLIDARSVTGQMIAVDGGQHLAWRTPDIIGA